MSEVPLYAPPPRVQIRLCLGRSEVDPGHPPRDMVVHARPFEPQPKVILEYFVEFWRQMPTKRLQDRTNGSKNGVRIAFQGPWVRQPHDLQRHTLQRLSRLSETRRFLGRYERKEGLIIHRHETDRSDYRSHRAPNDKTDND